MAINAAAGPHGATFAAGRAEELAQKYGLNTVCSLFQLRHDVFHGRLRWIPASPNGLDVDEFDALAPTHGLVMHQGVVVGGWRLLPTIGPYMLADIFPDVLRGNPPPKAATIWEVSRFSLNTLLGSAVALSAAASLLQGLFHTAYTLGADQLIACSDVRFQRLLERAGMRLSLYGPPVRMADGVEAVAGVADVASHLHRAIGAKWSTLNEGIAA
ncbi:acyl-homoserine-lactone synthase [Nitrospirillum amazonense]|uniref:acyl-homoserine-lactone synthase n=1 Tax=Nitrospirillum amazonense TaxID=28077 RepID=UPI002412B75E|nr:acyl-homoserine-lactone synthase [Nitrospirillum amazonense]MDG3444639.1 acyl-homoserine-lactone synthase [Nitrospirillum amazonense]